MPGLHQRAACSAPVCCFNHTPPPNTKIPLRNTPAERYEQKLLTQTNRANNENTKVAKAATHGPFISWGGEWSTHKHNTVATVMLTVQLTLTFIWLFASDSLQGSFTLLQLEQTRMQMQHCDLFLWVADTAQSMQTAHTHTHTCPRFQLFKNTHAQSTGSYLQLGGGSKVISASSFWILKRKDVLCYNHTHTQLHQSCL